MPYVIYRKTDQLICAYVKRHNQVTEDKQLVVEIQNVINSELGGTADDYTYKSLPRLPNSDEILSISAEGLVSYSPDPAIERRAKVRDSALKRFHGLGFSDEEIDSLSLFK